MGQSPDPIKRSSQGILLWLSVIIGIVGAAWLKWIFYSPAFCKNSPTSKSSGGDIAEPNGKEPAKSANSDISKKPIRKGVSWIKFLPFIFVFFAASYWLFRLVVIGCPQEFENDDAMHFKYGSIGSDNLRRGIPYNIWRILPGMFAEHLPKGKPQTYEAFGLITENIDEVDRPIGFSKRWHLGVGEVIGLNCAFCHVSTIETQGDTPEIILGMPANTVDVESFFQFLFKVADDPRFTVEKVLTEIGRKHQEELGYWETFIQRQFVIPYFIEGLKNLKYRFSFLDRRPTPFGPGRVETWAAYKVLALQEPFWIMEYFPEWGQPHIDMDAGPVTGLADFPALWKEKVEGGPLHWDGNNRTPEERNITAALGAGVTPATLDLESLRRIAQWMKSDLKPVPYHHLAPKNLAITENHGLGKFIYGQGKLIFEQECYYCHDENGDRIKLLEPVDVDGSCRKDIGTAPLLEGVNHETEINCGKDFIGTDPERLKAFTKKLSDKLNEVRHLSVWEFENYRKTSGYANMLLTGIWLRAPYLHNGSVPTLWHLLQKPEDRPEVFCRGNDAYDWEMVGFEWKPQKLDEKEKETDPCKPFHYYDTRLRGNGNGGHLYGTDLSDLKKERLIEYLKTL